MGFRDILVISSLCVTMGLRGSFYETIHERKSLYTPPDEIVQGFVNCDARLISKYFNASVELIFNESSGVYGKSQAEQILRTFFNNNTSATGRFTYKHRHGSDRDNAQYYIGELHTGKGLYRVTILMKDKLIYQMKIESND